MLAAVEIVLPALELFEMVPPASELIVEKPVADKVLVAGNLEIVGSFVGRVGNSVVEIAVRLATHSLATVAGNEHVNQIAVERVHIVELWAAIESTVVHLLVPVAFAVSAPVAPVEVASLAASELIVCSELLLAH